VTLTWSERIPGTDSTSSSRIDVNELYEVSAAVLRRGQLRTGEMATFFEEAGGGLGYIQSSLPSAYVHDALSAFDPTSIWGDTSCYDVTRGPSQKRFLETFVVLRRRIRAFLSWQEGCNGSWRYFGHAGGAAPDPGATALAALALLETPSLPGKQRWRRQAEAVEELTSGRGRGVDLATAANALRLLALVGRDVEARIDSILDRLREPRAEDVGDYRTPIAPAYAIVRAWERASLPKQDEMRSLLLPLVLDRQREGGSFGAPLSTAMGLWVLRQSEHRGPETQLARAALLEAAESHEGWPFESFLPGGGGALACTTAFALEALASTALDEDRPGQ